MKLFRGQPDHDHWRKPFLPKEKASAWAGIGVMFFAMGAIEWFDPDQPPFYGKWSWLYRSLYDAFGQHGIAVAWFLVGAMFLVAAISTWLKVRCGDANHG